jgi:hypothetical protein
MHPNSPPSPKKPKVRRCYCCRRDTHNGAYRCRECKDYGCTKTVKRCAVLTASVQDMRDIG